MKKILTTLAASSVLTFLPVAAASATSYHDSGSYNNHGYNWQDNDNEHNNWYNGGHKERRNTRYNPSNDCVNWQDEHGNWHSQDYDNWRNDQSAQEETTEYEYLTVQITYIRYHSSNSSSSSSQSGSSYNGNNWGGWQQFYN